MKLTGTTVTNCTGPAADRRARVQHVNQGLGKGDAALGMIGEHVARPTGRHLSRSRAAQHLATTILASPVPLDMIGKRTVNPGKPRLGLNRKVRLSPLARAGGLGLTPKVGAYTTPSISFTSRRRQVGIGIGGVCEAFLALSWLRACISGLMGHCWAC